LRVCDIDWPRRTLTVNETQMWVKGEHIVKGPKTESGIRTIPIPEWLIEQLATSLSARTEATGVRPSGTDRMFVSPTDKPMYDHTLWRIVHNGVRFPSSAAVEHGGSSITQARDSTAALDMSNTISYDV